MNLKNQIAAGDQPVSLHEAQRIRSTRTVFRRMIVAMAAVTLLTSTAACGSSGKTPAASGTGPNSGRASTAGGGKQESISVLETTPSYANLSDLAVYYGTAKQFNLKVKNLTATGGGAANQQYAGGVGDIFVSGFSSTVHLSQSGLPGITILADTMQRNVFVLFAKKGSSYHSIEDLKGKTIGVTGPASLSEESVYFALKEAGMSRSDVHIVDLGSRATQLAGVEQGHVDAGMVISPVYEQGMQSGKIQVVKDFQTEPYPSNVVIARTSAVKKNPELYCRYLSALKSGVSKLKGDPAFATMIARKAAGPSIPNSAVSAALKSYLNGTVNYTLEFTPALYNAAKKSLIDSGEVKAAGFPTYQSLVAGKPKCN